MVQHNTLRLFDQLRYAVQTPQFHGHSVSTLLLSPKAKNQKNTKFWPFPDFLGFTPENRKRGVGGPPVEGGEGQKIRPSEDISLEIFGASHRNPYPDHQPPAQELPTPLGGCLLTYKGAWSGH